MIFCWSDDIDDDDDIPDLDDITYLLLLPMTWWFDNY